MGLDNAYGIGSLKPGVCTSTTRPGSPFDGQLIYETDTNRVAVYDTNAWVYKTPASTTGSVLQVVSTTKTDTFSATSTSFTDVTGLSVSITPSSTSSKILVSINLQISQDNQGYGDARLVRDSTAIAIGDTAGSRTRVTVGGRSNDVGSYQSMMHLDSPNTTSATTYKVQVASIQGGAGATVYINRTVSDTDVDDNYRSVSSITVMEIAG